MSVEVLDRWTGVILYSSATAQGICAAVIEAVSGGAVLRGADLRGADLRGANLCGAKQYVIRIQGSRHEINAIDDDVRVGCCRHPLSEWLEKYQAIGAEQGYTPAQIAEYGLHLKHIAAVLEARKNG